MNGGVRRRFGISAPLGCAGGISTLGEGRGDAPPARSSGARGPSPAKTRAGRRRAAETENDLTNEAGRSAERRAGGEGRGRPSLLSSGPDHWIRVEKRIRKVWPGSSSPPVSRPLASSVMSPEPETLKPASGGDAAKVQTEEVFSRQKRPVLAT